MTKRQKVLNEISKHTNKRITNLKARAANPFMTAEEYNQIAQDVKKMVNIVASENTFNASAELNKQLNIEANRQKRNQNEKNFNASAELNKQLNIKGKEINKANTNKKIREGVEFKLKEIKGLTNTDIEDFMKKWNTSKNKTIFNQARKRGAGRLAGKKKTEERAKSKEENNFNASAAMTNLNLAPQRNKLFKKAKTEVGRFGGRIGKWNPAIKNAKTNSQLENLEKQLNKKVELRKEIQMSKIGPIKKRGHLEKVMELKNNVTRRRKIFEQQLSDLTQDAKKRELSRYIRGLNIPQENKTGYIKRINAPNPNLSLIRASANKQVNQKISNASKSLVAGVIGKIQEKENAVKVFNRQSATSVINRLKKLSQVNKTKYKGQISRAETKAQIKDIQENAVRVDARMKFEENKKKEEERKKRADVEAERVRKMKAKKAAREAAERAVESAKKMLTETEKMKAKARENKKFNNKLAEKRRLLREREAKLEPKKRKSKKKQ